MRILATGDWHTDWSTAGLVRQGDVVAAAEELRDAVERLRIDMFVFDGDLADPYSPRSIFAMAHSVSFARKIQGTAQIWIPGNHDVVEDGSGVTTLHPLAQCGFEDCCVAVTPERYELGEGVNVLYPSERGNVVALPYTPASHPYNPEEFVRKLHEPERVRLVVSHLMIEGHEPGSETKDMPRGRDVFLPVDLILERLPNATIVNGHYHRAFSSHGGRLLGPGSLERLTFGEEHNTPGYLVHEW